MSTAFFPDAAPSRPIWLVTLADLALLLLGFFVLVMAHQGADRRAIVDGVRQGFAGTTTSLMKVAPDPSPVAAAAMFDFAAGSSALPTAPDAVVAWAREATRDRRVTVRVTGYADGSPADVDPVTGSAALLASDRARAIAAALADAKALPRGRVTITSSVMPGRRGVYLTIAFAGERQ